MCTQWLVVDQLNIEKKGIPTITIVTSAFEELFMTLTKEQGIPGMAVVVTEHPIAGHNLEGIKRKADKDFPELLRAATQWHPAK